ncbi:MAG: hypothetical protein AABX55_03100 [Nanoarchaeota archaeon]
MEEKEVAKISWINYNNEDYLSKEEFISLVSYDGYLVKKYEEKEKDIHHHSQYHGALKYIEGKLSWVDLPINGQKYVSKSNLKQIIDEEKGIIKEKSKQWSEELVENELTALSDLEKILKLI